MKSVVRILLLGKTGVGKSSFINYFLDRDVAATGVGEPCTQEITKYTLNAWDDCSIELYDSKGLEVLDADNWTENIVRELEEKRKLSFSERYHTIFYCISAKKKIEDFEINTLKTLYNSAGQQIHIILTHCDEFDEQTLAEREDYLKREISDSIFIYRVVSIDKIKRNGSRISKYGRETVLNGVFDLLWSDIAEDVSKNISHRCRRSYFNTVLAFRVSIDLFIKRHFGVLNLAKDIYKSCTDGDDMFDDIEQEFDEIGKRFFDQIDVFEAAIEAYSEKEINRLAKLYNSYSQIAQQKTLIDSDVALDIIHTAIESVFEPFNDDSFVEKYVFKHIKLGRLAENLDNNADFDNFRDVLKVLFSVADGAFSLKKDLLTLNNNLSNDLLRCMDEDDMKKQIYQKIVTGDMVPA